MNGLNQPFPTEHFVLKDEEKKLTYDPDTKNLNTGIDINILCFFYLSQY